MQLTTFHGGSQYITKQLWATKKSTVEGHGKALQIAHNPIALGWAHWEGRLQAPQCREHV